MTNSPDRASELLPCPFCGEKSISFNEPTKEYRYGSINCPGCLVTMPGEVRDQDELIGCWNAREPVLTGLQEDLILMSFHNEPTPQPSPPAQRLPQCVHAACDDPEWCAGEPKCRYGVAQQPVYPGSATEALIAKWRAEAKRHEAAAEEPNMDAQEYTLHDECHRVYSKCADELAMIGVAQEAPEPLSLQAVREDERLACWKIAEKECTALKNADPTKAAWLVAFDIANAIKARSYALPSTDPRCTCAAIVNPDIPHARFCPLSSTSRDSASTYCALCDHEHQLHEDAQGFHHVVKGARVACPFPTESK